MNPLFRTIARSGLAACSMAGITSAYRKKQSGACILMYHGFSDAPHQGMENHSRLHLGIKGFRSSAKILAKNYNVISLQELAGRIKIGAPLPDNAVVLTFDDGYASNYHLALPVLEEFGLHATIFASTAFIEGEIYQWPDRVEYLVDHCKKERLELDFPGLPRTLDLGSYAKRHQALLVLDQALKLIPQERHLESLAHLEERAGGALSDEPNPAEIYKPMTWEQVRKAEASKHLSIGAHTHKHIILGNCAPDFARQDMVKSLDLLRKKGGVESPTFAYPNGKKEDYNDDTQSILKELGVSVVVTTEMGFNHVNSGTMNLNRMGTPHNGFQTDTICSGIIPGVKKMLKGSDSSASNPQKSAHANA